jgi:type VI secretion system protein ImpM
MRLVPAFFGKVPVHGDFIRHNVAGAEIDLLDQWLQNGIVSSRTPLGAGWDAAFDATRPQRFLFQPPQTGRVVAGVIAASKDRPGRRYFSIVHTVVDPSLLGGEATLLPAVLGPFLDAAEREAVSGGQGGDLKGFLAKVDALPLPAGLEEGKKAILSFAAGRPAQQAWQDMFGAADDPRKYLLVHNLVETFKGGPVPRYALRVPGVRGAVEASFWLELVRKLARRKGLPTLTLWGEPEGGGAPGLTALLDDLKATYFLPLWWPARKSPLLFPLAESAAAADPRVQQAKGRYGTLLDDGTLRLSALLARLIA